MRSQELGECRIPLLLAVAGRGGCWFSCRTSQPILGAGVGLCQWAEGFPAGSLLPCSVNTMNGCDRDVGQGKLDSHLESRWAPWMKQPLGWAPGCTWNQPEALSRSWLRDLLSEVYPASSSDLVCDLGQGQTLSGPQLARGLDGGTNPCPKGAIR